MGGENDAESSKNSNQIVGGGISLPLIAILLFCPFLELKAIELSEICTTPNSICTIQTNQQDITNNSPFTTQQIKITNATITNFTNYSTITSTTTDSQTFYLDNGNNTGKITHLTNKGNISDGIRIYGDSAITSLANYGEMRGIWANGTQNITINNFGIIKTNEGSYQTSSGGHPVHFMFEASTGKISIENYKIKISETQSEFNAFTNYKDKTNNKNSHLIIWKHSNGNFVEFKDEQSKLLLDVGDGFEFGAMYKIAKLITDQNGDSFSNLSLDFSRLALSDERKDIYELLSSGDDSFIIRLINKIQETPITAIYKANIRTMNNFWTMSNAMIFPRKYSKSQNLRKSSLRDLPTANRGNPLALSSLRASEYERGNPKDLRAKRSNHPPYENNVDSALSLKSYESFAYQSESQNLQTRRIQRQKRNYSRNLNNPSLRASASERGNQPQNLAQNPHDYYFILAPFVNYNSFAKSGNYNLSGFDYGFLTAFSGKVAESNLLGAHFAFSYGSLNDKHDKDLSIRAMNFMLGVNYKLDLIYDMFLKARGDVFYFANALDSATLKNIKPNNLGFGASVLFGKEWDFKSGDVLGIEAGIDYKALQSNEVLLDSQTYKQSLYNLIYADLGLNYAKYFGGFGINLGAGFKANLAPNLAKSILLAHSQNQIFVLDNDKYLGYANVALSYVLNHRNFDMEFSLAYYGNFGDRVISNGGGFEWRVNW